MVRLDLNGRLTCRDNLIFAVGRFQGSWFDASLAADDLGTAERRWQVVACVNPIRALFQQIPQIRSSIERRQLLKLHPGEDRW
jgi:hypothetical protein